YYSFFNDPPTTEIYTLSLHDALPISVLGQSKAGTSVGQFLLIEPSARIAAMGNAGATMYGEVQASYYNPAAIGLFASNGVQFTQDRKSTRLNSSHVAISYAVFCLKKK